MLRVLMYIGHYLACIVLYGIMMVLMSIVIDHQNITNGIAEGCLYFGMGILVAYPAIWLLKQPDNIVRGGSKAKIAQQEADYWRKEYDKYSGMYLKEAQRAVDLQRKLDRLTRC